MKGIATFSAMVQVSTIAYATATGAYPHWFRYVWAGWLLCWLYLVCSTANRAKK